jgi:opacity protein-like surface antigen
MKKLLGLSVLLLLSSLPTLAQYDEPKLEVGGGYTFRSLDVPFSPRLNMNGWDFNAAYNFDKWIGVAADVDGTRNDQGENGLTKVYTVMGGPRFYPLGHHRFTPFVQVMAGHAYLSIFIPASGGGPFTITDGTFAWSAGGGLDATLTRHFAVRLGEFDYEQMHSFLLDGLEPGPRQNNFKFKAGVVVRF